MRQAKLYIVEEQDVTVHGDVYRYAKKPPLLDFLPTVDGEALTTFETIDVPVHKIRKIEHGQYQDSYIAIDPTVKEIIESPLVDKIHYLVLKMKSTDNLCVMYENRIGEYNSLPWYKRIFKKV